MKKIIGALALLFVLAGALLRCVDPPDYPVEPVIEFLRFSKTTLRQTPLGQDSVVVTIGFTDGDGDLGFQGPEPSLFVVDGRDSFSKPPYRIPYVDQQGAGNGISGEISFVLPTTCCVYTDPQTGFKLSCENVPVPFDSVFYYIQIRDRAGHFSNRIATPKLRLICR
ncbi:MAG: hypothetical protein NZM43_03125 [Saprospiraceae bacterium]|nr:hypothetical protein [Saprospiraceae bacterium]MDW8483295.1 hypothetical protein [Saprospiraceae bacterium]